MLLKKPSFYILIFTRFLIIIIALIIIFNIYKFKYLTIDVNIKVFALFGILIAIYKLQYLGLELAYKNKNIIL